jgi:hypothetical protein
MKKLFLALMLVFFVSSFSFAQINKGWDGTKPEVYQGSKSFIFLYSPFVSNNLTGNFAGTGVGIYDTTATAVNQLYGVGFQYFVSSNISLGGGLTFGSGSSELQHTGAATTNGWLTRKSSATTIGINVDANYHFKSLYSVSPYLGLNVNFAMQSAKDDGTTPAPGGSTPYTVEYSGNVFGAGINFGFDWYFTPGLSLGGKYTLGFATTSGADIKTTSGAITIENKGPKASAFGTGIASIMLNVHF